ncbi:MAG: hypothetical protein AAFQ82_03030 [Myxococcota bacterium]
MTFHWTYVAALALAFVLGLAGTVFAAKALSSPDVPETSPALLQPAPVKALPTVEC